MVQARWVVVASESVTEQYPPLAQAGTLGTLGQNHSRDSGNIVAEEREGGWGSEIRRVDLSDAVQNE